MAKRRERLEIIHDILKTIMDKKGKIKPTHILYKSNLSPKMLKEYLNELMTNGLITENIEENRKTYALTKKGNEYLDKFRMITDFAESFGVV